MKESENPKAGNRFKRYHSASDKSSRSFGGRKGARVPKQPRSQAIARRPPMPFPDGRCNPMCPYFRCLNNALVIIRKPHHGRMQKTVFCRWIGDECIGGSCRYASCALKALLPDGRCLYAVEKKEKEEESIEALEREVRKEEQEMSKIDRLMKKRGYELDEDLGY